MPLNDVYQVKFHQTYGSGGKALLNVFYYRQMVGSGDASDLRNLFDFYVVAKLQNIQATLIKYITLEVINLDNPADYDITAPSITQGFISGTDVLPAFVCWAFRFNRTTRAVRNGAKRFAGVLEGDINGAAITGTGINENLSQAATIMSTLLVTADNSDSWAPRIFRPYTERPGKEPLERADFPVGSVTVRGVSTQNTRK